MGVPRATVDKTRVSDFPRYGYGMVFTRLL